MILQLLILKLATMVNSFDYYTLAVQNWCSNNTYMIHGLWPDNKDGTYPTNCDGPNYVEILDLENKLNKYWYDCNEKESRNLWIHEWNKHGKCVFQQEGLTQEEYFSKAIDLFLLYSPKEDTCFSLNFERC